MGKLISVHVTPLKDRWWWLYALPLAILLIAIVYQFGQLCLLCISLSGGFIVANLFYSFGLPGWPAKRLEIYEEGIVYCTLNSKKLWFWTDIFSFSVPSFNPDNQFKPEPGFIYRLPDPPTIRFTNFGGEVINILPANLAGWNVDSQKVILIKLVPLIYERIVAQLNAGEEIVIAYDLSLNRMGLIFESQPIEWREIQNIFYHAGNKVVIVSPLIDGDWIKTTYWYTAYASNGIVYGLIIRHLWHEATGTLPPDITPDEVVNGVAFNSYCDVLDYDTSALGG